MERMERLLVHVDEAFTMATVDDDPHLRLSLLLFDSAAELILHRESEYQLHWHRADRRDLDNLLRLKQREGGVLPEPLAERVAELEARIPSKKKTKTIKQIFDAKSDYLVELDILPSPIARVLRKLHRYRNEAYHRDHLRPATLRGTVTLYGIVVCDLMRRIPAHYCAVLAPAPPLVARFLSENFDPLTVVERAADAYERCIKSEGSIAEFLSDHLIERLDEIDRLLDYCADFISETRRDPEWDAALTFHHLQLDEFDLKVVFGKPSELWAMPAPRSMSDLTAWRARAMGLANVTDPIEAFRCFAEIEDELEPVEQPVIDLVGRIDDEINLQVGILRGK